MIRRIFSLTGFYSIISTYGYDYVRALIVAGVIVLIPIIYQILISRNLDVNELTSNAVNYTKTVLRVETEDELVGSLIGIVAIPILGAIILTALKRTFDRRRKS